VTNIAPAGSVGSTSVGSTWTDIEHTVTLGSGFNNLIVFIWSGDTVANTDFIRIEAAQLEQGPYKTPFETRPVGMELALCQRYFQRLARGVNANPFGAGQTDNTTRVQTIIKFPVTMRVTPTTTVNSGTNFTWRSAATSYVGTGGTNVGAPNPTGFVFELDVTGANVGDAGYVRENGTGAICDADAEL
jgi:hypothetical protein